MIATLRRSEITGLPSLDLATGKKQLITMTKWPDGETNIAICSLTHADVQQLHDMAEEWLRDEAFEAEAKPDMSDDELHADVSMMSCAYSMQREA